MNVLDIIDNENRPWRQSIYNFFFMYMQKS